MEILIFIGALALLIALYFIQVGFDKVTTAHDKWEYVAVDRAPRSDDYVINRRANGQTVCRLVWVQDGVARVRPLHARAHDRRHWKAENLVVVEKQLRGTTASTDNSEIDMSWIADWYKN